MENVDELRSVIFNNFRNIVTSFFLSTINIIYISDSQFAKTKRIHGNLWKCKNQYEMRCAINFTKSSTPPWVFFTFLKLSKWYQIEQNITYKEVRAKTSIAEISLCEINLLQVTRVFLSLKLLHGYMFQTASSPEQFLKNLEQTKLVCQRLALLGYFLICNNIFPIIVQWIFFLLLC